MTSSSFSRATPRERSEELERRWAALKTVRAPWLNVWKEITRYIAPFSGRYSASDHMESRTYDYILDDYASYCINILVSGLASGATSPLRPWFRLVAPDIVLSRNGIVRSWLNGTQDRMYRVFQTSNTYNSLHQLYREMSHFGTGVDLILDDLRKVISHHVLTAGEYCIATNAEGEVDTLYREFEMTVAQAVKFFGYEKLSRTVKLLYDRGMLDEHVTFIHAIEPRADRDVRARDNLNMPWASYYFEENADRANMVRESGFRYFPALCPRWDVTGADPYGVSPTFSALPDVKELQQMKLRKSEIVDLLSQPPVEAPVSARNEPLDLSPGGINFLPPGIATGNQVKPIIAASPDIQSLNEAIQGIYRSLDQKYYVDMFLMLRQAAGDRKTTVEVSGLQEEQRLILGPVTERLSKEVQRPLLLITLDRVRELGLVEPPPQELMESGWNVEIQSVFAQAQRAVDINAYDRYLATMQSVAAVTPDVLDRIDPDGLVEEYADRLGISWEMMRSREDAEQLRQQRAQAQQSAMQSEQAQMGADTLNSMAQAQKAGAEASLATQGLEPIGGMI